MDKDHQSGRRMLAASPIEPQPPTVRASQPSGALRSEMNSQETSCGSRSSSLSFQARSLDAALRLPLDCHVCREARQICDATATTSNPPPTHPASRTPATPTRLRTLPEISRLVQIAARFAVLMPRHANVVFRHVCSRVPVLDRQSHASS